MPEEKTLTDEQVAAWLTTEQQRDICMEAVKASMSLCGSACLMQPEEIGRLAVDTFFAAAQRVHELRRLNSYK
jgi:hypothetical protein